VIRLMSLIPLRCHFCQVVVAIVVVRNPRGRGRLAWPPSGKGGATRRRGRRRRGGLQSDDQEGMGAPVPRRPLTGSNDGGSGSGGRSGTLHASYCNMSQSREHDGDKDKDSNISSLLSPGNDFIPTWVGKLATCRQQVGPTAKCRHIRPTCPCRGDTNLIPTQHFCVSDCQHSPNFL
jgi:hypothetical protein